MIQCSQDQWDIYKLDPLYECLVRVHPHLSRITRKTDIRAAPQNVQRKRRASSLSPAGSKPAPSRKKRLYNDSASATTKVDGNIEEESSVEEMVVDPLPQANNTTEGLHETSIHSSRRDGTGRRQGIFPSDGFLNSIPEDDAKKRKSMSIANARSYICDNS